MLTKTIAMIVLLSGVVGLSASSYAGEPEEWRINQFTSAAVLKQVGSPQVATTFTFADHQEFINRSRID